VRLEGEASLKRRLVITIDGPAGAGKSTISKLLASRLSYICLETGALYRAEAYRLKSTGWNGDPERVGLSEGDLKIVLEREKGGTRVILDGRDITEIIRSEEIGLMASTISAIPKIREKLLPLQRKLAAEGGVVAEGRDMGSVVFPDADVKFYLDASVEERVNRRYLEMRSKGVGIHREDVENDMRIRDRQDSGRSISPLVVPADAVVVDSSNQSITEVVDFMMSVIERNFPYRTRF